MPRKFADIAVFLAPGVFVILWASGFIGAKLGLPYAEPFTFLTLRMIILVAVLTVIALVTRPLWPTLDGIGHSIVTGLLVHGSYLGGVYIAIDRKLPAGLTALVVGLQPLLTSTIANRFLGERVIARQWIGLALGVLGVYLVVADRTVAGQATTLGWAAAVFALIGITLGTLYQKRFGGGIDWRAALLIQYASAGTLFVLCALAFETRTIVWSPEFVFALAWLVFVMSLGAVWLLYYLIRQSAATRVSSLFYLTPPVTALMAWLMFNDQLGWLAIFGMGTCAVGVFLVNWRIRA